jgi:signal transduction histidine kinase
MSRSRSVYDRTAQACGALVAAVGAAALLGWAANQPVLRGLRSDYIPMAPNTALAFLLLGAALMAVVSDRRWARGFAGASGVFVGLVGILRLCELMTGLDFSVDRWFVRVQGGQVGFAPVGKMSLPSAAAFVAASVGLAARSWPSRGEASRHGTGACGLFAGMIGLIFTLGYLFGPNSPLLYGTHSIPMALNTALCFVGLGFGLTASAGPTAFPLLRLTGPSIRARLLRTFLPLVVGTVGVVAWLTLVVTTSVGYSSAAISSAALAAVSIVLFGAICERIAGRVGGQIERAEAELQQARDLLEVKVIERTRDLSCANEKLERALHATQAAHESLLVAHRELKQTQSRMLQQARMASLGQTAAGVAHEINNPLAFVTNNFFVLKREVAGLHDILLLYREAEETLAEYQRELHGRIALRAEELDLPFVLANLDNLLERSREGLLRIQRIVADLRDFAHLEEAEFKEVDLNEGILTTVRVMQSVADKRQVALDTKLGAIQPTTCFPAKINLVVQSLISNGIDACPIGGRVVVESRGVDQGTEIAVSDNGCGIPSAIRERIFDPFFTTKPVGKGTGLGLSISYGIIKDHGGTIECESTPGAGSRFTIRLPLSPPTAALLGTDAPGDARDPRVPA